MHLDDSDDQESDKEISELPRFGESEDENLDPELTRASARLTLSSSRGYQTGASSTSDGRRSAGPHSLISLPKTPEQRPPSDIGIPPRSKPIIHPSHFRSPTAQSNYRDWETDRKSTRLNSSH